MIICILDEVNAGDAIHVFLWNYDVEPQRKSLDCSNMGKIFAKEKVFCNGNCWIGGEYYKYLMTSEEDFCKNWS